MIAEMSRVELVCLRSVRAELVRKLQDQGLLHLDEVPTDNEEAPDFLNRLALGDEEHAALVATEDAERALSETAPLLTMQPSAFDVQAATQRLSALSTSELFESVEKWAELLRATTRKRLSAQDQLEVLTNYQTVLEQVAPSIGSSTKLGKGTRALVLTGDVSRVAGRIDERLTNEFGTSYKFHKNQSSKKHLVGLLTFPEDKGEVVSKILNQEGVAPMGMSGDDFSDLTASEMLDKIKATITKLNNDLGKLEGEANVASQ